MRALFIIISNTILLLFLFTLISPVLSVKDNSSGIVLSQWEVNTGNCFEKCGPVLWDYPPDKGGAGAECHTGYGTYRTLVNIPSGFRGKQLGVFFNGIDDTDETYLNGFKIGSTGAFPESEETGKFN